MNLNNKYNFLYKIIEKKIEREKIMQSKVTTKFYSTGNFLENNYNVRMQLHRFGGDYDMPIHEGSEIFMLNQSPTNER